MAGLKANCCKYKNSKSVPPAARAAQIFSYLLVAAEMMLNKKKERIALFFLAKLYHVKECKVL
ncbi:hypothetical protein [Pseudanabaena sp. lw0831]|uniref:hypothetical protein n=1 Tax=Pseudanabaena sp. lw0831 TaxID=1357935 RepID=UPI0019161425|nr:hypothetical protein [Pseudanabaena sp. lw0831]